MEEITRCAYAKINLSLRVLRRRADGYHDLRMVMQTLSLHDTLVFRPLENGRVVLHTESDLPTDGGNLIVRAAERLLSAYAPEMGAEIALTKRIPVAAGLAGGSADAAAALLALRDLYTLPVSDEELAAIGLSLGADVPYCLTGGSRLAEGVGEKLTALPDMPPCAVLLVKPPVSVSTAEVFRAFRGPYADADTDWETLLARGDLRAIAHTLRNDLEAVTIAMHPVIADIKAAMLACGAAGSLMSGSGPTVFGLFETEEAARGAAADLRRKFPGANEVHVCTIHTA